MGVYKIQSQRRKGSVAEGACMREIDGVGLNLECEFN